jgi:hypothetical protein
MPRSTPACAALGFQSLRRGYHRRKTAAHLGATERDLRVGDAIVA